MRLRRSIASAFRAILPLRSVSHLPVIFLLPLVFLCGQAKAQFLHIHLPEHPMYPPLPDAFPSRWSVSFNPFGFLEEPGAVGLGLGYRPSRNIEIWSETSLLGNFGLLNSRAISGMRQILQVKRFLHSQSFFLAFELRYKYYSYRDTNTFGNAALHDTISNVAFQSNHYIFGGAFQIGSRFPISKNGRLQFELMMGFGMKDKIIRRVGPPPGYEYLGTGHSTDVNIWDLIETAGWLPYFPGSIRFVYSFGKELK